MGGDDSGVSGQGAGEPAEVGGRGGGEIGARRQWGRERLHAAALRHQPSDLLPREFTVTVEPANAGARVWLGPLSDVEIKGGKAVLKDLPDGEHELVVQAEGYQPFTTRVMVEDGRGRAEARLVAVKGIITISASRYGRDGPRCAGRDIGLGTVPAGGVLTSDNVLTVGGYTLKLAHADCSPLEMPDIELVIGRAIRVAPAQTPLPGELRVFSVPTGAEVRVNGVVAGATPASLKNQPTEQALRLAVFLQGYRRVEQTIALKPKETAALTSARWWPRAGGSNYDLRMTKSG